jgi:aryl-alcohol dehydrogenase-like predicted oxidoreductase
MRYVELHPGVKSSVIGFGCAPILGSVDAGTARHALTVALDEGINHFDLAPSYGYGEAQRFVGRFLGSRKHDVVIASKFGIQARAAAAVLRPLKPLIRRLRGSTSGAPGRTGGKGEGARASAIGGLLHRRVALTPALMAGSVERSLRALDRDYLDILLIHEPLGPIEKMTELRDAAAGLKQQGKIRAWGLAVAHGSHITHRDYLHQFDVLQIDNSPSSPQYAQLKETRGQRPTVFFSPFRLNCDERGGTVSHHGVLAQMTRDFPRSVVLCSMFQAAQIRENARAGS